MYFLRCYIFHTHGTELKLNKEYIEGNSEGIKLEDGTWEATRNRFEVVDNGESQQVPDLRNGFWANSTHIYWRPMHHSDEKLPSLTDSLGVLCVKRWGRQWTGNCSEWRGSISSGPWRKGVIWRAEAGETCSRRQDRLESRRTRCGMLWNNGSSTEGVCQEVGKIKSKKR